MNDFTAAAHSAQAQATATDRRAAVRYACDQEALSRPLDPTTAISWGTTVVDASHGGLGLIMCFPFKLGTFLVVDLEQPRGNGSFLVRVARVEDRYDGTWHIGCEFARPLADNDLDGLI